MFLKRKRTEEPIVGDLISRKEAIDTLYTLPILVLPGGVLQSDVRKMLKDLQPVNPDEQIVYCKDCEKHNRGAGDCEKQKDRYHWFWKDEICPLVAFRGKAQGHEFDYQWCVYGKRKDS